MPPKTRCEWPANDELMLRYHDTEWGVPLYNDQPQFEFLVLEGMQAGLSWRTVLYKRENYRRAFAKFDPVKVARYSVAKIDKLMQDRGLIRNRMKLDAAVHNANRFLEVQREHGSFSRYLWGFTGGSQVVGGWRSLCDIPAVTELSHTVSADLKRRGFKFVGPAVVHAHLQAAGLVNDHTTDCFRFKAVQKLVRKGFVK